MVDHRHHQNLVPIIADNHLCLVANFKQLVLLQRTVEHIDALRCLSFKFTAENLQLAALLTGTDQSGVNDGAVVNFQNLCHTLIGLTINFLVAGRNQT